LRRHISGTPTRRTRVEIFWMSRDGRTSVSPSASPSVRPSVSPSVRPSVRPLCTLVRKPLSQIYKLSRSFQGPFITQKITFWPKNGKKKHQTMLERHQRGKSWGRESMERTWRNKLSFDGADMTTHALSSVMRLQIADLRTVPTKYKCFCARLGPRGKSRSFQGLMETKKKNGGSHVFFRDN